ncbi:ComF family protein [Neisseria sp. S1]|uniref:ComF family protein n=1 Tax=Neisseria sp. S1 TaxID=3318354 RepID=UPI003A8B37D1
MKGFSWWRRFFDMKRCVLCHVSAADGLCEACSGDLKNLRLDSERSCPLCLQFSVTASICGACQKRPPPFEKIWASVYYEPPLSSLLHAFKHQGDMSVLPALVEIMRQHPPSWLDEVEVDAVLAMPLSKSRRIYRGFNQADELAVRLAGIYGWQVLHRNTVFRHPHAPQSTLKRADRQRNVRHAFEVEKSLVKNRKLLLIDDVVTTGATLAELSRILKRAGAQRIFCWSLARAQMKKF